MIPKNHKPEFYGETKCKVHSLKMLGRPLRGRAGEHPKATGSRSERFTLFAIGFFLLSVLIAGFVTKNKNENKHFISPVSASEKVQPTFEDIRRKQIKTYLAKYNSPLHSASDDIVTFSVSYAVDPALTVAVARQESSLGNHSRDNNHWGIGGASGLWSFQNTADGVEGFAKLVGTSPSYKEFRKSHDYYDLARVYCPPRNSKGEPECDTEGWAKEVEGYVKEIEKI